MPDLVNLGEVLTPEACKSAKKGQVYGFKQEDGSITRYKVIRINKAKKAVWAERVNMISGDDWEELSPDQRSDYLKKGRK